MLLRAANAAARRGLTRSAFVANAARDKIESEGWITNQEGRGRGFVAGQ
jgi:hypothetical protein